MRQHFAVAAVALTLLLQFSCRRTPPAGVAATVNGHAITYAELDKIFKSQPQQPAEGANEDQIQSQKLDILGSLITNEIMLQRAEKLGLTAVDADVDTELAKMRAPYTKEEFEKTLSERNMSLADLRSQIRRQLTVDKLVNREITSKISISDSDVANFYNRNKASYNLAEPQVHLAQILVTPAADPNVRNLKNSKAVNEAEANRKIREIEARLRAGEKFSDLAQNYSEDPQTAPSGGDMGFIAESALEKANPELRKMVMSLQPGSYSQIIHTQEGYRILAVIAKEPAGQREINDPRVQQDIRETLLNRKDTLLRAAFYEVARNGAKVENYMAQTIVQNAGK